MANGSQKYIKNIAGFGGGDFNTPTNTPAQYASRQTQYMADRTRAFDQNRAYLSTDFFTAQVQGLNLDCFYEWETVDIRLADIVSPSATASKKTDDYKHIMFPDIEIEYFPIGAKVVTAGSTWLCVNPTNISSAKNTAVVARCNASYNSYDFYGNVITEPIVVEKYSMLGNDNESPQNLVLMDGYFNITCQLNENTRQIKENSRIILGTKAYHITGVTDFVQEFTADRNSCHIVTFTARVEEPDINDDITKDFVAGGNTYTFAVQIQPADNISVGDVVNLRAVFVRNGQFVWQQADLSVNLETGELTADYPDNYEQGQFGMCKSVLGVNDEENPLGADYTLKDGVLYATLEHPVDFIWESENYMVATITPDGQLTALAEGETLITATLKQNPNISASVMLQVASVRTEQYVEFTSVLPESISQYEQVTIQARYFDGNQETTNALTWSFGGATAENYSVTIADDGLSICVECLSASETPLEITASYNGQSATTSVNLYGY